MDYESFLSKSAKLRTDNPLRKICEWPLFILTLVLSSNAFSTVYYVPNVCVHVYFIFKLFNDYIYIYMYDKRKTIYHKEPMQPTI